MRTVTLITAFVCLALVSFLGVRGTKFTLPPLDLFPEWAFPSMEFQPRLKPQGASRFFADGRADRRPVPHTVARGMLRDDDHLHFGRDAAGAWARGFPDRVTVDMKFLQRGRERYAIYCAPCHSEVGDGNGITKLYGMGATPSYHEDRLRDMPEGEIYNTITHGKNTMLPYADKLAPEDRWAVVAYVRALQRARQGGPADVADPAARRNLGLP